MFNGALRLCSVFALVIVIGMSQEFRSTLSGRVSDPSGASIPAIKVTVVQNETGSKSETATSVDYSPD